jgi:DNA polymerase III subunit delta
MAAQSPEALVKALKKREFARAYYLHGPEDVLKDEAVRTILDLALDPAMRDFNFDQRSAAQLNPEDVYSLCNTVPMLAERRVVVIRDVEAWKRKSRGRAEFLRYLEQPNPQTVVIMVQGSAEEGEDRELSQLAFAVRCESLSAPQAVKWVLRQAGRLGLQLETAAAEHLVNAVGPDLGGLNTELAKLASLPSDLPLTAEHVGALVGVRRGETLLDWRTAIIDEQSGHAISLLPSILAQPGISGVKLVTALGTSLLGLALTRACYDGGLRGRALDDAVFKALLRNRPGGLLGYKEEIGRWTRVVAGWPAPRIRAALRATLEADQALKNTTISDERGVLTDLILRLGSGAKARSSGRLAARAMALVIGFLVLFSIPGVSQTDPRLVEIIRNAQQGQGDSARIKVEQLLAATSPSDSLYPQILYTKAMVSGDASDMRRQLQRIAVEYSSSSWADDALLRLVQLDYASGNLDGAARNLERIRQDYPGSALLSQASYWAARTYFDLKKPELACRWLSQGVTGAQGNVELQNQLSYLNQRCAKVAVAGPAPTDSQAPKPAPDSQTSVARGAGDSVKAPMADSAELPGSVPVPVRPVPTPGPTDTLRAGSMAASPRSPSAAGTTTRYWIQITAVRTRPAAEAIVSRLKTRGYSAVVAEEGGLYKVRIGSYATKADAATAVPGVKAKLGGSPFVVAGS